MSRLRTEWNGHIARITLNRPAARNALSRDLVTEFREAVREFSTDPGLRVLVIAGTRESSAFCAGADLVERTKLTPAERLEHLHGISALCEELAAFPSPTIAAVHGYALGGGSELALACDIRVAERGATFGFPEVTVGLLPGAGGVTRLPALIGPGRARDLMFTGRRVPCEEAEQMGLVDRVVALDDLDATVQSMAATIAANAPLAIRALKRALRTSANLPIEQATLAVLRERIPLDETRDYLEGITAFAEKRKPVYSGE